MRVNLPAFPSLSLLQDRDGCYSLSQEGGITKRELFAAMAMQAIASNPEYLKSVNQQQILSTYGKEEAQWSSLIAWMALDYADALLAELVKDSP